MTEAEKIRSLVAYRIGQANEALRSADVNLAGGLIRSAVNRAYYAMFYAVLALLATRKAETSRHSGAISLFDRDFVKLGMFPKEFSRWLHDAFDRRHDADYATDFATTAEHAAQLIGHAREFSSAVVEYLTRKGFLARP